jgi:hypothetical protein
VNSSAKKLALVAASTVILGAVLFFVFRSGDDDLTLKQTAGAGPKAGAGVEADPEYIIVGGVRRKATDVNASTPSDTLDSMERMDVGTNQPVSIDANPQVESLAEALRSDEHPERLSPLARPAPFDAKAFAADPQAYLNTIEPGRVFQTAQPGPGVEVLRQMSPRHVSIRQGEKTKLRVKAVAGAPVTFKSFDLGRFENELTTISVRADGEGVAEVEFFGSPGTYSSVNILAGSPLTTGQAKFVVSVEVPRPTASTAK